MSSTSQISGPVSELVNTSKVTGDLPLRLPCGTNPLRVGVSPQADVNATIERLPRLWSWIEARLARGMSCFCTGCRRLTSKNQKTRTPCIGGGGRATRIVALLLDKGADIEAGFDPDEEPCGVLRATWRWKRAARVSAVAPDTWRQASPVTSADYETPFDKVIEAASWPSSS